jgi:hypothetical protein
MSTFGCGVFGPTCRLKKIHALFHGGGAGSYTGPCVSTTQHSTQLRDLWVKNNVCYKIRSSTLPVFNTSLQIYLFPGRISNIDVVALYRMFKLLDESKLPESDQPKHPVTQAQPPPQGPSPARFRPSSHLQTLQNPEFAIFVRSTEEVKIQLDDMSDAINNLHVT